MECVQERPASAEVSADRVVAVASHSPEAGEGSAAHRVRLTPTQQRLLGYIAAQTTIDGGARCSKKDFADMLHCDVKTVDRAITRLRREKMIEVETRFLDNGGQLPNVYRVAR